VIMSCYLCAMIMRGVLCSDFRWVSTVGFKP
jgi:hypothetical protein